MKKLILFLSLVLFGLSLFGQKLEKMLDKYNVSSAEVMGHLFSVGDTLTFNKGSSSDGEFLSTMSSPALYMQVMQPPPHLPADFTNTKFIIQKIRSTKYGLNSEISIVIYIGKDTPVWINTDLAITNKEILLK